MHALKPYQELRSWARSAPVSQRIAAAVGAGVVLAVLGWLMVPTHVRSATDAAAGAPTDENESPTATDSGSAPNPIAGASNAGPTVATPTSISGVSKLGQSANGCATGTGPGVSDDQLKIAVILFDAAGPASQAAFGAPTAREQQEDFQFVIDDINSHGGVACRKLVPQFFAPNPLDQTSLQQACLDVQNAGVIAVIDAGAFTAFSQIASCFPRAGIPLFKGSPIGAAFQQKYFPYVFTISGIYEVQQRNAVMQFSKQGFFDPTNGFKKLGVVYRSCEPDYFAQLRALLRQVGVPDTQVVTYDFGCSAAVFASPSDVQQAVLTFQRSGVSHVIPVDDNPDIGNFTNLAQSQGFHPKYGIADNAIFATTNPKTSNYNSNNLDGAVGAEMQSFGEDTTPGATPSAGTVKCNAIFAAHGRPPVYEHGVGMGGIACSITWMFAAAAGHAPSLDRRNLVSGLHAARMSEWSYPFGPNDYSSPTATTGGQFWRPLQYFGSCRCWHITDLTFRPSFP